MTVMTKELAPQGDSCGPDEDFDEERDHPFFADPAEVSAETYPKLRNISVGFMLNRVARALEPVPPEYVTLPLEGGIYDSGHLVAVAKWNLVWESAQFRRRYFDEDELPAEVTQLADRGDVNVTFVPRTATRYYEYAPLYHLLSRSQAERHSLPLVRAGIWPYTANISQPDRYLPADSVPGWAGRGHRRSGGISVPDRP